MPHAHRAGMHGRCQKINHCGIFLSSPSDFSTFNLLQILEAKRNYHLALVYRKAVKGA
jgi:hypothetical protein